MLMKNDKKQQIALIMGKLKNEPKPAPNEDGAIQDDSVAVETAAEELISAIESKSAKGVVEAIKSLMELCESPEPEQPEN